MGQLLDLVGQYLDADDWHYERDDENVIRMGFAGENGRWTVFARALEEKQQILFYSLCPLNAAEARRPAMAEFLTRANYGMVIGNFEMDYSDGEIRYKTSIDVENSPTTTALVKPLLYANCLMMDRYLPGITQVIAGGEPAAAIQAVENPS